MSYDEHIDGKRSLPYTAACVVALVGVPALFFASVQTIMASPKKMRAEAISNILGYTPAEQVLSSLSQKPYASVGDYAPTGNGAAQLVYRYSGNASTPLLTETNFTDSLKNCEASAYRLLERLNTLKVVCKAINPAE